MIPPFPRTKCGCTGCRECCTTHPGYLIPGDIEMVARHLDQPVSAILHRFAASPGAVVADKQTGAQYRIPTIIPAPDEHGRCNFLDERGRCSIHDAAPFGCAYFDVHQSKPVAMERSMWALREILEDDNYIATRSLLAPTKSYKPRPY